MQDYNLIMPKTMVTWSHVIKMYRCVTGTNGLRSIFCKKHCRVERQMYHWMCIFNRAGSSYICCDNICEIFIVNSRQCVYVDIWLLMDFHAKWGEFEKMWQVY